MSIRRSVSALLAAPVLASAAAGQAPAPPAVPTAPAALPAAFTPVQASPFPAVSQPLTAASPITAPISAAPAPVGIAPYPPPPGPPTLGQFLGLSYPQREYRQRRLARTPFGQLRERVQTPLSKLTGGLIPPFPPQTPSLAELQAPGPVGAAAKVKLDRETAADRIKAVEYLGTVDCHYWPEAEDALVGALRADRNEWVRLAAAQTLGKGCCCTKKTITALTMVVSCSMEDGNPVEKSPQVIAAAQAALDRCLAMACACEPALPVEAEPAAPATEQPRQEQPRELPESGAIQAAYSKPGPAGSEKSAGGLPDGQVARPTGPAFYERVARMPWGNVIAAGRAAMMSTPQVPAAVQLAGPNRDLDASGVDLTPRARTESPPPANLLDMLMGEDKAAVQPALFSVVVGTTAVSKTTAPAAPVASAPTASNIVPPALLSRLPHSPATAPAIIRTEPPLASARSGIKQAPTQPPVLIPTPAAKPTPAVTPAAAKVSPAVPAALPRPTPPAPKLQPVPAVPVVSAPKAPEPVPPPAKPVVIPASVAAPQPAAAPRIVTPPAAQAPVPPPAPVAPAVSAPAARVIEMLTANADPRQIETEVDKLTPADFADHAALPRLLMTAAEEHRDPWLRSACIRALGRGKAGTAGVVAGLERLLNDRMTTVRVDAAVALEMIRIGK